MHRRRALAVGLVGVAALATAAAGLAAATLRPAPGAPDPRQMVLTAADLGGAKVTAQGYYKDKDFPSVISYSREFDAGRYQGTPFVYTDSEAEVGTSAASTSTYLATLRRVLGTKQGRALILRSLRSELSTNELASKPQVGRPRTIPVGSGAFDLLVTVRVIGLRTEVHITAFAVERALGSIFTVALPGTRVPLARLTSLARLEAARMTAQLAPANSAPPTIAGTAQDMQTLTASPGTWRGAPATVTYQWQRCTANGSGCVDIAGATAATYLVTTADVGSTLRVNVTAQNGAGTVTMASQPTAVVLAAA